MPQKAFTLVELIVVITILAVLGTLGFMSFQGYAATARDAVRVSDLMTVGKALEFERTKNDFLPLPDNAITITASGTIISYQGLTGPESMGQIGISETILDPKDQESYMYTTNKNKTEYQLLGYLEGELSQNNYSQSVYADKNTRNYILKGKTLGIIVVSTTNESLNTSYTGSTFDLYNSDNNHKMIFGSTAEQQIMFSDSNRAELAYYNSRSCRALYEFGSFDGDKLYTIYPSGVSVETYCNMSAGGREVRNFRTFDGVNDYVEIPELTASGDFELELETIIPSEHNGMTLFSSNENEAEDTIIIDINNGSIRAFAYVDGNIQNILWGDQDTYADGHLHKIGLKYVGRAIHMYIDGENISTKSWDLNGNQTISSIGKRGEGARYWKGIIANVNFKSGWSQNGTVDANPYYRLDDSDDIAKNSNTELIDNISPIPQVVSNNATGGYVGLETRAVNIGKTYLVDYSINSLVVGGVSVYAGVRGHNSFFSPYIGSIRTIITALSNQMGIIILSSPTTINISNISIKEAPGYGVYNNFSTGSIERFTQDENGDWLGKELWSYGDISADGSQLQYDLVGGVYHNTEIVGDTFYKIKGNITHLSGGSLLQYVLGEGGANNGIQFTNTGSFHAIIPSGTSGTRNHFRDNIGGEEYDVIDISVKKILPSP